MCLIPNSQVQVKHLNWKSRFPYEIVHQRRAECLLHYNGVEKDNAVCLHALLEYLHQPENNCVLHLDVGLVTCIDESGCVDEMDSRMIAEHE